MAINATNTTTTRELVPAGNYIARCYQMLQLGTNVEVINGESKRLHKVRIGWELPTELKVFDEAKGEQPIVINQEYTLSLSDKSNLRKMLESWRGQAFTKNEAKSFDITKLLGVPCMVNVIHQLSKATGNPYSQVSSVTPLPKGVPCPEPINKVQLLEFDNFNMDLFLSLPDFLKDKITSSEEYKARVGGTMATAQTETTTQTIAEDDLPF